MKKILIVAALLAATAVPATPSFAKAMALPAASPATCMLLPLMPDCVAMWKAKMAEMPKVAVVTPKIAIPAMPAIPALPTCAKAPAGSGHLFDCGKL